MTSHFILKRISRIPITLLTCLLMFLSGHALAHHCKGGHANDPACDGGGGDGGGDGGDTSQIPLDCAFADNVDDTIISDELGDYQDSVDKVLCTTGSSKESLSTSHVRLKTVARGKVRNAVRKVDLVIDESTCTDSGGCAVVPDGVFEAALSNDDMEDASFGVRAYTGTEGLTVPHIQNLTPDKSYEVSMSFALAGTAERWSFQMMGRALPDDFKQGTKCDLAEPADAISEDVTLYVWPDGNSDGTPDGYTITTAQALNTSVIPPEVNEPGKRQATLCSNVDPDGNGCGGPGGSDLCHLISKMDMQFTLHAENQ